MVSITFTNVKKIAFESTLIDADGFSLRRLRVTDEFGGDMRITLASMDAESLIPQIDETIERKQITEEVKP